MKTKIIKTIVPTILGIVVVLGLLILKAFARNGEFTFIRSNGDIQFYQFFLPVAIIIALIIQVALTLPTWNKFKNQKRVFGLSVIQLTVLICIISGLAFGLTFWETEFGIKELINISIFGIIAFAIYWTINLLTLKQLDRQ